MRQPCGSEGCGEAAFSGDSRRGSVQGTGGCAGLCGPGEGRERERGRGARTQNERQQNRAEPWALHLST